MNDLPGRTGVLTFHRCINYGSYWQARCLVEGLRSRGYPAVLLDHRSGRIDFEEWKCGLRPVLPLPAPGRDYLFYGVKILRFHRAIACLPRSRPFPLHRPAAMERFQLVLVGSDEVWNFQHPWYAACPLFFGDGVQTRRLVAHAASFGNCEAPQGLEPAWAARLRRFHAISVRDENSRRIVERTLGFSPHLVLDPCLHFPPQPEPRPRGRVDQGPFAAVYGHNFSARFAEEVRRWAHSRKLPLLSLGYRNDWADRQWITATPGDFAWAMSQARAVASNFFHGCVFALRFEKPFVCEGSFYRSRKLHDLLAALGAERHLVSPGSPPGAWEEALNQPLEPAIRQRIEALRRTSDLSLRHALA